MMSSVVDRFRSYFQDPRDQEIAETIADSRALLSWMAQEYYAKFLEYLDENASGHIDIGSSRDETVKSITRVNTFREIRQHLARLESRAKTALDFQGE